MGQIPKFYNSNTDADSSVPKFYDSKEESAPKGFLSSLWDRFNKELPWVAPAREKAKFDQAEYEKKFGKRPDDPSHDVGFGARDPFSSYYRPDFREQAAESHAGTPAALTGTALMAAMPAAKAAGLAKTGMALEGFDRGLSGATAIAEVPSFTEAIRKGDKGKVLGSALGIGLGTLGARKVPEHPDVSRFPEKVDKSFTLENPNKRNLRELKDTGFEPGPVAPNKRGQLIIADDRIPELPPGTEGPLQKPTLPENIQTKVRIEPYETKLKTVKRPVKDETGAFKLDENGKKIYEKVKKQVPNEKFESVFQRWANGRRAADLDAKAIKSQFKSLDDVNLSELVTPLTDKKAEATRVAKLKEVTAKLKPYFDQKFAELSGTGKKLGYREDYIPQMWANTKEEIDAVFGNRNARLSLKKGFENKRVLENYAEGIANGLTPKFEKVSDIVGMYEGLANRGVEDKNFFQYLKDSGLISTKKTAGRSPLPADLFPVVRGEKGNVSHWNATPEVADAIEGFLKSKDDTGIIGGIRKANRFLKTSALAAGVPGTGINFHGISIVARDALSSNNKLKTAVEGIKSLANPRASEKYLEDNLAHAADAARDGLLFNTEHIDFRAGNEGKSGFMGMSEKLFEDPLFQKVMPAMKLEKYDMIRGDLIAKGLAREEAGKLAAQQTNQIFGSVDFKTMLANNKVDKTMKFLLDKGGDWFLAPQWLASQGYIGKDMLNALRNPNDPRGRIYQQMAKNLAVSYTYANVTNKILSGHWMGENDHGHFFDVDLGQTDDKGKKVYVSPFGTAADFLRLPVEAAHKLISKDPNSLAGMARGRLGPLPQLGLAIGTGENWAGKPLKSFEDYAGLGADYVPPYLRAPAKFMQDDISTAQALTDTFELPIRYRKPEKKKYPKF